MNSSTGILTVDLGAIRSNWSHINSLLASGTECSAVVKANAYGVGAIEVAQSLFEAGCRTFFVATLEEASELRGFLPREAKLLVLGGVKPGSEAAFVDLQLIPVLYSIKAIHQWLDFCHSRSVALPCAIKLDTGMTRLGLGDSDFCALLDGLSALPYFNPILLMSHLACADEIMHPLNRSQLEKFEDAVACAKVYFPKIRTSLANSSGTFLGKNYHFDMVRVGAALYGINPQPSKPNPLRQVIHLALPILQIRTIESPVAVGYGATVIANNGSRLAVVAGGYADGVNRTLGPRPQGSIDGEHVFAIGRISMDSCIFDISSCKNLQPEFIDVINHHLTVDSIASANQSLGYEVLTSLGRRYKRKYLPASN